MKRTRAQQPKAEEPQDPSATVTAANPKPQRRAKQPRQPKAAGAGAKTKPGAAGPRVAAAAAAAANAGSAASSPGGPEMVAPTVPDVCVGGGGEGGDADDARAVDWDLDDAGLNAAAAWWTWGVDEEKLLGWFPFVEEDFRCAGGHAGDAEVAAFDHDIWSIW
ncbi:uncharacterized protein [Miscanthus floridulus]|uniref:uncharacterized protein n=1 Tax=Miscanthus floridulus TaxID=154761 RepID=UPI003457F455